jgi:nickel transport protein
MKLTPLALLTLAGVGGLPTAALGHGVIMEQQETEAIEVVAQFDTGEPMSEAQVVVFSPEDPQNPWSQGRTDSQGRFWFRPDQDIVGTWEVIVRQAGHGGMVTVEVSDENADLTAESTTESESDAGTETPSGGNGTSSRAASANAAGLSPGHQAILMGTTVWGFVGTALFFWRRKD